MAFFSDSFEEQKPETKVSDEGQWLEVVPFMKMSMTQNLLSKEVMYLALKDLTLRYPMWLEIHKDSLKRKDLSRYQKQLELMLIVCQEFEAEGPNDSETTKRERFQRILGMMDDLQQFGSPPEDLIGDIAGLISTDLTGKVSRETHQDLFHHIEVLQQECQTLEMALAAERAKYLEITENVVKSDDDEGVNLSFLPEFAVNDSFTLNCDASYLLAIDVAVPIDVVILQSEVPIEVIDSDKNSAVVSFSESETQEVLVTFRCQSNTTRLEISIRTIEGQYGVLRTYIISRMTPKSCQLRLHHILPLSLHKRCSSFDIHPDELCRLEISGDFTPEEGLEWLRLSVPEVPDKMESGKEALYYNSTLFKTLPFLSCTVSNNLLVFESDNVSTISILKDFITRKATSNGVRIGVSTDISDMSVTLTLKRLYPLTKQLINGKKFDRLRLAATELGHTDSAIADDILKELHDEEEAETENIEINSAVNLDRVLGLITDLFIDDLKLKGKATKSTLAGIRKKVGDLQQTIESIFETKSPDECDEFVNGIKSFWLKGLR